MQVKLFSGEPKEIERQINDWFDRDGKGRRIVKTCQSESGGGPGDYSRNITISVWHCNPKPEDAA